MITKRAKNVPTSPILLRHRLFSNTHLHNYRGITLQSSNSSSCFFNDASEDIVWEMFQFTPTNPSQNQIPKSEQKVRNFYTHPFFLVLLIGFSLTIRLIE